MTAEKLWCLFQAKSGITGTAYEAWAFGDDADALADLVLRGIKTATCSLYRLYQDCGEALPQTGAYSVILNSKDEAVCIIRTEKVTVLPYEQVTEQQAYLEGEGDRSLAHWQTVHEAFFSEELKGTGIAFDPSMEVVFEEFSLQYVPDAP